MPGAPNLMMAYQLRVSPIYMFFVCLALFPLSSFAHSLLPPTTTPLGMWQPSVKTWLSRTRWTVAAKQPALPMQAIIVCSLLQDASRCLSPALTLTLPGENDKSTQDSCSCCGDDCVCCSSRNHVAIHFLQYDNSPAIYESFKTHLPYICDNPAQESN